MRTLTLLVLAATFACTSNQPEHHDLRLWYDEPAAAWTEALPIGNGRLGAMVFGTVSEEHIQFNEETLWTGHPHDYAHEGAYEYLDEIRTLLFDGKQKEAEELAMQQFMSDPLRQKAYQPFGDVYIKFEDHDDYTDYCRELDIKNGICKTSYKVGTTTFTREVFASHPDDVIVMHLMSDGDMKQNFSIGLNSMHELKRISARRKRSANGCRSI
jgi:alpha-L-fucosidase 2